MATTEWGLYQFVVKEYESGDCFIVLENAGENIGVLEQGLLGFELPKGMTVNEAEELALVLNANMMRVGYTPRDSLDDEFSGGAPA